MYLSTDDQSRRVSVYKISFVGSSFSNGILRDSPSKNQWSFASHYKIKPIIRRLSHKSNGIQNVHIRSSVLDVMRRCLSDTGRSNSEIGVRRPIIDCSVHNYWMSRYTMSINLYFAQNPNRKRKSRPELERVPRSRVSNGHRNKHAITQIAIGFELVLWSHGMPNSVWFIRLVREHNRNKMDRLPSR